MQGHVKVETLLRRGWTEELLRSLLGEPHQTRIQQGQPVRYYRASLVGQAEASPEFRQETGRGDVFCAECGCKRAGGRRVIKLETPFICEHCKRYPGWKSRQNTVRRTPKIRLPRVSEFVEKEYYLGPKGIAVAKQLAPRKGWTLRIFPHADGSFRTEVIVIRATKDAEKEAIRKKQSELLAYFRKIGWRGRKLLKAARKRNMGPWRVSPEVARRLLGTVPEYHSPYGPYLENCLALVTGEPPQRDRRSHNPLVWLLDPDERSMAGLDA